MAKTFTVGFQANTIDKLSSEINLYPEDESWPIQISLTTAVMSDDSLIHTALVIFADAWEAQSDL